MGAQLGSGRKPSGRAGRRVIVRLSVTEAEARDLILVAQAWSVPVGTAAYGLLAESLARCRRRAPVLSGGLPEAMARYLGAQHAEEAHGAQ